MQDRQTSSVPTSGDAGRQGRRASPTNPTKSSDVTAQKLTEKMDIRCTLEEKLAFKAKAEAAGISSSQLLREALGLADAKRRKPLPSVHPDLIRLIAQTTRSLQILSEVAVRKMHGGWQEQLELTALIAAVVAVDRQLSEILLTNGKDG